MTRDSLEKHTTESISCTWKSNDQCKSCKNSGVLKCRWNSGDLFAFCIIALTAIAGGLTGVIVIWLRQVIWWPTAAFILSFPVLLGVLETRVLCSHCPYYSEEGRVLHCLANHGLLKLWKYNPGPMNKTERIILISIFVIFALIITVPLDYNIIYYVLNKPQYGSLMIFITAALDVITFMALLSLLTFLIRNVCTKCINFSCPLNRVNKENVDAYLEKNPIMRKAWEETGYYLGGNNERIKR